MYDTMDLIVPILIIAAIAVIILAFFKSMKEINDNKKAPLLAFPQKFRERERISSNEISQMPEICLGHMVILW